MRKELGKWLMDISKYIVTAVLLSTVFADAAENKNTYTFGFLSAIFALVVGLILVKETKQTRTRINNKNKKRR